MNTCVHRRIVFLLLDSISSHLPSNSSKGFTLCPKETLRKVTGPVTSNSVEIDMDYHVVLCDQKNRCFIATTRPHRDTGEKNKADVEIIIVS